MEVLAIALVFIGGFFTGGIAFVVVGLLLINKEEAKKNREIFKI